MIIVYCAANTYRLQVFIEFDFITMEKAAQEAKYDMRLY